MYSLADIDVRVYRFYTSQIQELYRQFALVKSVALVRDPATHYAKGLAFVEFHSPEYAQYGMQHTNGMPFGAADMAVGGDTTISVSFARLDVMQTLLSKVRHGAYADFLVAIVTT
jgi:hypothetical protein